MTITIFGATGMVGKELVQQALNKNHIVRAFGRNVYTSGFEEHENLRLVPGALFDQGQVYDVINGSDAVLSAVGGSIDATDKTRSLGMKNIVAQMERAGTKRIIAIGSAGLLDATDDEMIMNMPTFPKQLIPVSLEHYKAYESLKHSKLDWTFVCAPDIIYAGVTGMFYTAAKTLPTPNNNKINSGDLAMFMLNELAKDQYVRERVGISN
jgi:uncharacterized protein